MEGYLNYSSSEIVTILVFGGMFFLFAYASAPAVYYKGFNEIKQNQTTLSAVISKAIIVQIVATLLVFVLVSILDIQSRFNNMSNMQFTEATATFFRVEWTKVDIGALVAHYDSKNIPVEGLGTFIVIMALWSLLRVILVFVPIVIMVTALAITLHKHKENKGGLFEIASDFFSTMILTFIIFVVHLNIPFIIIENMYEANKTNIIRKIGSAETVGLNYSLRAGSFFSHAINSVISSR